MAFRSASKVVVVVAATVGLLVAVACGSSGGTPATAGAGQAGAGSGSGGANVGGSSGGSTPQAGNSSGGSSAGSGGGGDSLTEACIAYALGLCVRNAECQGQAPQGCLSATYGCPDVVASTGSTRTVESLKACALEYETFSCEQIAMGALPACVSPGTFLRGEPCAFHSQCASLVCKSTGAECGLCAARGALGDDCSAADSDCDFHLYCDDSNQCAPLDAPVPSGPRPGAGEACTTGVGCLGDYYCDSVSLRCVAYPALGMSCADRRWCVQGSYCELDALTCQSPPAAGLPCGVDAFTGDAAYCADGLVCHRSSKGIGTCNPPPAAGQPCLADPETQEPNPASCGEGRFCDITASPPACFDRLGAGADCKGKGLVACQTGLSCLCNEGARNLPSCAAAATCATLRLGGQSCTGVGELCHPGYACTGGVCVPRDSQGLFEAACTPK